MEPPNQVKHFMEWKLPPAPSLWIKQLELLVNFAKSALVKWGVVVGGQFGQI